MSPQPQLRDELDTASGLMPDAIALFFRLSDSLSLLIASVNLLLSISDQNIGRDLSIKSNWTQVTPRLSCLFQVGALWDLGRCIRSLKFLSDKA